MTSKSMLSTLLLLLGASSSLQAAAPLHAETSIVVTTFDDELNSAGDCSLREAIQSANQNLAVDACAVGSGDDVITLAAGTYTLSISGADDANASGDLDVITSLAGERLTIQGAGASSSRIDGNTIDRVFHVAGLLSELRLVDVTVQNGQVTDVGGGGVLNWGTLELENVVITNNTVNGTTSDAIGGGVCNGCVTGTGQATLVNTVVQNNAAQRGGGIFSNRPLTVTASLMVNNLAISGAGIANYGPFTLENSTLTDNTGSNNAGAISQNAGSLTIRNSTISHNTSAIVGGISSGGGTTALLNTIVANNAGNNCSGDLTSQGHNLSSDASCAEAFTASGDLNSVNPRLGALASNGGPTWTRALLVGSPAINAGTNADCPATDQRGIARPQGGTCDIGAYEREGFYGRSYLPLLLRDTP